MSTEPPSDDGMARLMELTGDFAVLPAGSRLADENRPGHQCFVLLDGAATVERAPGPAADLHAGREAGELEPVGSPQERDPVPGTDPELPRQRGPRVTSPRRRDHRSPASEATPAITAESWLPCQAIGE